MTSCAFKFEVKSKKTKLENQMFGEYDTDSISNSLISTVRGGDNIDKPLSEYDIAVRTQLFNKDDLDELQEKRLIGETESGLIEAMPQNLWLKEKIQPLDHKLVSIIINEENKSRNVIWSYSIKENANLNESDLPNVRKRYANQMIEKLASGKLYKNEQGKWIEK